MDQCNIYFMLECINNKAYMGVQCERVRPLIDDINSIQYDYRARARARVCMYVCMYVYTQTEYC
jgi:hypothetical protein